ncbi:MAG: hypothetical protein EA398_05415 [Deltaproteobacteria bacterium]|nr:MAG: hypothetical protein EA398_05415 [Deltaproteobacteria bacterium]
MSELRVQSPDPAVAVIMNPSAGTAAACPLTAQRDELAAAGIPVFDGGGPSVARAFVANVLEQGVRGLIVSGGDGTLHRVLNALREVADPTEWPAIALCPAGTTNLLAGRVGLPGPECLVDHVRETPQPERWSTIPVRTVDVGGRLGIVAGAGFMEQASRAFGRGPDRYGKVAAWAALEVLGAIVGLRSPEWLRVSSPLHAVDDLGAAVETGEGVPLTGLAFTAEPAVARLFSAVTPADGGGLHVLAAGGEPGPMLRQGLGSLFRLRRASRQATVRRDDSVTLARGTRIMLDGEYFIANSDTVVSEGPTFRLFHPTFAGLRTFPLLAFHTVDRRAERSLRHAA